MVPITGVPWTLPAYGLRGTFSWYYFALASVNATGLPGAPPCPVVASERASWGCIKALYER